MASYLVKKSAVVPAMNADWNDPAWKSAEILQLGWVSDKSVGEPPKVELRVMHTGDWIHGMYRVTGKTVLATHMKYNDSVCRDSCCEFFFEPDKKGYFNLEMNCVANHLIYYVHETNGGLQPCHDYHPLAEADGKQVKIVTTLGTAAIPQERPTPEPWVLQFAIPVAMLEKYAGTIGKLDGLKWRGNFYKCADDTKEHHWLAWQAVEPLDYHQPRFFGDLLFE